MTISMYVNRAATYSRKMRLSLGFVPVRIMGPEEEIEGYAFLENDADTTASVRAAI